MACTLDMCTCVCSSLSLAPINSSRSSSSEAPEYVMLYAICTQACYFALIWFLELLASICFILHTLPQTRQSTNIKLTPIPNPLFPSLP